ncbi:MAG: SCP2 sterol-binding domain-containing protein [Acidimicrobiales bacterium]
MAEKYEFLSPEWIEAAKKIRDEAPAPANPPAHVVRMNQIITGAPFNNGEEIHVHMDTTGGELKMDLGHLENPDLTVTVDWETAKAIFVDQNPQAGMQAFMAGKIKVQGDMTKLMAMQQGVPDPNAQAIAEKIKEITA